MSRLRSGHRTAAFALGALILLGALLVFGGSSAQARPSGKQYPQVAGAPTHPIDAPSPQATESDTPAVPLTATATSIANPTATTTTTPVPCGIRFSDVPPESTFYPYIRCLACQGFIGGYADATFRPNNNVTRGQLSKIVANAAGFNEPVPSDQQTYTDVPSGQTFWLWIERLSRRLLLSGYPCGGPGEPCDPQQRPYFRPAESASRGQVAKLISEARGFADPIPPSQQTFQDVPFSNPFWVYIERLSVRGILSGYPCGSPNEPCVPPRDRPYFRPNPSATRGQVSKVAAKGFPFWGCDIPEGFRFASYMRQR